MSRLRCSSSAGRRFIKYLGRKLSVDDFRDTEFKNRLAMGWASFFKLKSTLCNKHVPLKHRISLLEASVSPCVLYACGTWTMTAEMAHKLRSTQRGMLRWMMKTVWLDSEAWPEYTFRATHRVEEMAFKNGFRDWVHVQHQRKCKLGAKTCLSTDGRWNKRLMNWIPFFRCSLRRCVGHPVKRWSDEL